MGMYTEFSLDVTLDPSQSEKWAYIVCYMLDNNFTKPDPTFTWMSSARWEWMFHSTDSPSSLVKNRLQVTAHIKNYGSEIEGFLSWISPYVLEIHEGSYQYEEDEEESEITLNDKILTVNYNFNRRY